MDQKQIIATVEEAVGAALNEESLGKVIDERMQKALEPVHKEHVRVGELQDDQTPANVTFSQYLGDVRRHALNRGGRLKHLKESQLVQADVDLPQGLVKDLYEGTDSAGGYLVPTEESRQLINLTSEKYSVIPGLCRPVPMKTRQITWPTLTGGVTAYWVPEATDTEGLTPDGTHQADGEVVGSSPTFGQLSLTAHLCGVKVVVSNQLLDDSDPMVSQVLMNIFAEALGAKWDLGCLSGAGSATDPITGLDSKISTNDLSAGGTFDYDDIIDLLFAVIDQDSKANPSILGTTKTERVLMKLKDTTDQYIYKSPNDGALGIPTVWGQPYRRDGNISNVLGDGTNESKLYAGDFGRHGYAGRRQGVIIKTNPWAEPYYSFNQTAFLALFRVGFNVDHEKYFSSVDGIVVA